VVLITGDTPATGVFSGKEGNAAMFSVSSWIFLGDSLHWEGEEGKWGYDSTLLEWVSRGGGGSGSGGSLEIEDEALSVDAAVTKINFTGGVTVTPIISGEVEVNIPGGIDGVDGIDGIDGVDGAPGPTGPTGAPGPAGQDGTDGVATGDPMFFTASAVSNGGDLRFTGGSVSWHKNTRSGYLFPVVGDGDRLILQNETDNAESASITLTATPTFVDPVYTASATMSGTITVESDIRVLPAIRGETGPTGPTGADGVDGIDGIDGTNGVDGIDGVDGVDGVAVGFQLTHTTGTVDTNGEIGGSTVISWHKNDRNGVPLPVLSQGDRWFIQDETSSANYADILLGAVTFADPVYSAPATRTDGGAIGDAVNVRALPLIRGLPGVGGGSALEIEDEGDSIDTAITKINFTGGGVLVSPIVSGEVEVVIPGGGTSTTLDPDVSNYFSAYASLAFEDQILATNKMVVDLKREGLWPKIELLYVNFGDSIANVLVPLKGGNATADRTIVAGDIATAKGGGLEPLPPQLFLRFPQLASLVNYHLGWAKKPGSEITFSNAIEYTNASTPQGFAMASENSSNTLWFASGVAFNSSAHDLRSWQSGGFVGTATGNTNKLSINPYGRRLTTAANSILPTAPAFVTIRMIGPRQPAFCAGQNLSDVELGVLQGILDTFARNV
jgi:hypothetical protein